MVTLSPGSLGTAGSASITGLTSGEKYVVTVDWLKYGVQADGTLGVQGSAAQPLTGTSITGLNDSKTYDVQVEVPAVISTVPIVQWYKDDNSAQVNKWELGTVDAGNDPSTTESTFLIWNNREGLTDCSAMTNTVITTKDPTGNMIIPIVKEQWVEAKCDSLAEVAFTPIGADDSTGALLPVEHPIKAEGSVAVAGEILGVANDGTVLNAKDNYSKVTLRVGVPATAVAGNVNFLVRVIYEHI